MGKMPLAIWGPYVWADGTHPRNDGLTWECPGDYFRDGVHTSIDGSRKVAKALLDFLKSDATAAGWFTLRKPGS